jgi:hypothetical protein
MYRRGRIFNRGSGQNQKPPTPLMRNLPIGGVLRAVRPFNSEGAWRLNRGRVFVELWRVFPFSSVYSDTEPME